MKRYLSLVLMALPLLAAARPADPTPRTVTNPDGTTLQVRHHGDEFFDFYTDMDNNYILDCDASGKWVRVSRLGRELRMNSQDIDLLKSEVAPMRKQFESAHRMADLTSEGRTTYVTVSDEPVPGLVVLVQFADTKFTVPNIREQIDKMVNQEGYSDYGARGSAHDYFYDQSNGKFNVHFDVSRVVTLSKNSSYYVGYDEDPTGKNRNRHIGQLVKEFVEALDDEIDFSKYDLDKDGYIDNIFFFYAGHGQADTGDKTTIWPHQGSYLNHVAVHGLPRLIVDGVEMRTYACSCELKKSIPYGAAQPYLDGIGAFCHEYGHVLGLADLYNTGNENIYTKTPGLYDIMDHGSYNNYSTCPPNYSNWERWTCNWLEFDTLEDNNVYEIEAVGKYENPAGLRARIQRPGTTRYYNEFLSFESRVKQGWDTYIPTEGMVIWRINFNRNTWVSNMPNYEGKTNVEMMESSPKDVVWPGSQNVTATYPGSSNELTVVSNNPLFKPWVTNITFDNATGKASFEYNVINSLPDMATVLHEKPYNVNLLKKSFDLAWDPVEGATGYLLTVVRTNAENGKEYVVNSLDEYLVGDVTHYTIDNLTENNMKQEFRAYVRCHNRVPSSAVSNEIKFIPNQCDANEYDFSGVIGVEDEDIPVYGVNGAVVAPADAVVFSLSGAKVGRENLPAGVYIVTFNGKSKKVLVK